MSDRCPWCGEDPLYVAYHDEEWGVPVRDDVALFQKLYLDGVQAGLSWITVLRKRAHYYEAMDGLDPERMARWSDSRIEALLTDTGLIRNRQKMRTARENARAFLAMRDDGLSFTSWLWDFYDGEVRQNAWMRMAEVPAETLESQRMSKALKGKGFRFVGPTIVYAFAQAVGMVNDHLVSCPRWSDLS